MFFEDSRLDGLYVEHHRLMLLVQRAHLAAEVSYTCPRLDIQALCIVIPQLTPHPLFEKTHHFIQIPESLAREVQIRLSQSHTKWMNRESVIPASHRTLISYEGLVSRNGMTARSLTLSASTKTTPLDERYTLPRWTLSVPRN